jgi:two-component system, NarL family, response regulator
MFDEPTKLRVLVVDDHPLMRLGLRTKIEADPDMKVVGEADDGPAALAAFADKRPDVTLLDLRLPGMHGAEVIAAIRKLDPQAKILVLTSYDAGEDVYRAMQAGASGYLLKGTFADGILEAIRTVQAGRRFIAPELAARLAERESSPTLSSREVAVLRLVARGLSNREIGVALFVSEATIKFHLKNIYVKLGANDRTEATLLAVQRGILSVP